MNNKSPLRTKILFWVSGLCFIGLSLLFLPIQFIQTNELADNPQGCPYYITLQSILANYPLLASDKANSQLIKTRLLQFEKNVSQSTNPAVITYKNAYFNALRQFNLTSVNTVQSQTTLLTIAKQTTSTVDNYYLDSRLFCINPLYQWNASHSRRILRYNLSNTLNNMSNRFSRVLASLPDAQQLGIFSGFFVNNQTTTLGPQFMTGTPFITALYILPKHNFAHVGSYHAPVPWCAFSAVFWIDPLLRKVLNIAGIDTFIVKKADLDNRSIPAATPLTTTVYPMFEDNLLTYTNQQSYGMAYLANHIYYEDPLIIKKSEKTIKRYFARPTTHNPAKFTATTDVLYKKLMSLSKQHDIILESATANTLLNNPPASTTQGNAGQVVIKGIVGALALFSVDCERENCVFVFNAAKAPGWRAIVNGTSTPIERANFAFMATSVPHGQSNVWFIYAPWTQLITYFLSLLSLIGIFVVSRRI
ncbi:MAG TPA: YfhO family protein [Gammaproteobacteria bacterium]|jgi:hypothetical protein|nr:YfhO family protein [Gammaproteobacteria bacterium]